jgi:hypothetical protein
MMAFSLGFPVPTVARIALACHPGRAPQDWANKQKVTRKKKTAHRAVAMGRLICARLNRRAHA